MNDNLVRDWKLPHC